MQSSSALGPWRSSPPESGPQWGPGAPGLGAGPLDSQPPPEVPGSPGPSRPAAPRAQAAATTAHQLFPRGPGFVCTESAGSSAGTRRHRGAEVRGWGRKGEAGVRSRGWRRRDKGRPAAMRRGGEQEAHVSQPPAAAGTGIFPGEEAGWGGGGGMEPRTTGGRVLSSPGVSATLRDSRSPLHPPPISGRVKFAQPPALPSPPTRQVSGDAGGPPRAHLRLGGELDHRLPEVQLGVDRPHLVRARCGPAPAPAPAPTRARDPAPAPRPPRQSQARSGAPRPLAGVGPAPKAPPLIAPPRPCRAPASAPHLPCRTLRPPGAGKTRLRPPCSPMLSAPERLRGSHCQPTRSSLVTAPSSAGPLCLSFPFPS